MAGHFTYKEGDLLGPYRMELLKRTTKTPGGRWKGVFRCNYTQCVYWGVCDKQYEVEISLVVSGKRYRCGKGMRQTNLTDREKDIISKKEQTQKKPKTGKFKYNPGDVVGPYGAILLHREYKEHDRWYCFFKCPYCEKSFLASIHDVQNGSSRSCGCLKNSTKQWSNGCVKWNDGNKVGPYSIELIKRLDKKDEHNKPLGLFKCPYCDINSKCKQTFVAPIERVSNGITSSCGCKNISHGEEKIINILTEANIQFCYQHIFDDCRNPETDRPLRFDFYLPDYNCCIEYDGQQHFLKYVKGRCSGWNSLENYQQCHKRDGIKDAYCRYNNIQLIRIPYYDFNKLNISYLKDKMEG